MLYQQWAGASSDCMFPMFPQSTQIQRSERRPLGMGNSVHRWKHGAGYEIPPDMADDTARRATPSEQARFAREKRANERNGRPE